MKRYLNKVREISITLESNYKYTTTDSTLLTNEIFIGKVGEDRKGLFIKKSDGIYAISFDDFSYGFLNNELSDITSKITDILESVSEETIPTVSDEDGGL
jgi:hypothetical protein